jgi:transcriptional regulator with XRE-family HTH domain
MREIRKDAGLSGRALASATGQHFTRVSKIEHGVQTPDDDDIRAWCRACGADDQVPDLIATARAAESAYLEFRRQSRAGMKRVTGAHTAALYERTSMFRIYEHNVVPGLFQTAAYCAAMLSFWIGFLDAPDDLDAAVAARLERQKVVFDRGKRFRVVLEEQALRTWFGTAEVQAGQLGRLLELMSVPTIALGVIPLKTERSGVPAAGFWIFDDAVAALEIPTASIEVTRPDEISLYARMFSQLEEAAVHGAAARRLIVRALQELQLAQQLATSWTWQARHSYDRGKQPRGKPGFIPIWRTAMPDAYADPPALASSRVPATRSRALHPGRSGMNRDMEFSLALVTTPANCPMLLPRNQGSSSSLFGYRTRGSDPWIVRWGDGAACRDHRLLHGRAERTRGSSVPVGIRPPGFQRAKACLSGCRCALPDDR